jgi:hypothetical protein
LTEKGEFKAFKRAGIEKMNERALPKTAMMAEGRSPSLLPKSPINKKAISGNRIIRTSILSSQRLF